MLYVLISNSRDALSCLGIDRERERERERANVIYLSCRKTHPRRQSFLFSAC